MSRKIGEPCGWYRTTDPAEVACANPAPVHHIFSSGLECWTCERCAIDLTNKVSASGGRTVEAAQ